MERQASVFLCVYKNNSTHCADDTPGNKASEDAPTLEAKPGSTDIQTVRFLHGYAAFVRLCPPPIQLPPFLSKPTNHHLPTITL